LNLALISIVNSVLALVALVVSLCSRSGAAYFSGPRGIMSTPQPSVPQGPRRSARKKKNDTESVDRDPSQTNSDCASVPPAADLGTPSVSADHANRKRNSSAVKKTQNTPKPEKSDHRNTSTAHADIVHPTPRQATPVKQQAYAGPTFHSSPAPSALPIPSFYARSLPGNAATKAPKISEADEAVSSVNSSPEKSGDANPTETHKRESTPLDFLFEAARQARESPRPESPSTQSANLSTFDESPLRRSPALRQAGSDSMFPFEMDTNGPTIALPFAMSFKDRLEALHSSDAAPVAVSPGLDDKERKAKTEALKKLLMNSQPKRSASASPRPFDPNNPFHAKPADPRNGTPHYQEMRHRSGPSTPAPSAGPPQYFPPQPIHSHDLRSNGVSIQRPPSSHLRREYQPQGRTPPSVPPLDNLTPPTLISTARQPPSHKSRYSSQQLEDDVRRVLKLDSN
jgi:hypothetical protein